MDFASFQYSDTLPYPTVEAEAPNPQYAAAILSNIGACNSEMSAVSSYFYNSLITRAGYGEISECFHRISIVEMHHLDLFGELALKLGTDPRLWNCNRGRMYYWSPGCLRYTSQIVPLLTNALAGEKETIRKYQAQAEWIRDTHIKALLNRIILDEELHVHIFQGLLSERMPPAAPETASDPNMPGTCIPLM